MTFHDIFSGNWAPISTTRGWKPRLDFQQNPPVEIGAQFEPRTGGIPTFCYKLGPLPTTPNTGGQPAHTSAFACICYIAIASCPSPATPNPNPKIQNPNRPCGFWSLDFGFWISDFGFWILDFEIWISDFGFWILGFGLS